jgi:hypothetical protein
MTGSRNHNMVGTYEEHILANAKFLYGPHEQTCQQSSGLQALDCNSLITSSGANPSRYRHILVQSKPKSEDCLRQLAWLDALAPPEILGCEAAVLGGRLVSRYLLPCHSLWAPILATI